MRELPDVDCRLRRLERSHRVFTAALVALSVTLLVAWVRPATQPNVVRARRIQLVDAADRVRIDLRHDSTETGLFIADDAEDTRIGVAQFAHGGGGVALHGPGGRGAVVLYLKRDGSLTVYDTTGVVVVRVPAVTP